MMAVDGPLAASRCQIAGGQRPRANREPSMGEITTVGLDLAKNVFQVHGVDSEGMTVLRRQLRRAQVLVFFSRLPRCLVGMEACATSHYWARELRALGHEVRLMPAQYVKAYVKRNKNDAADAEAICEAVVRPSMRFVPVKTAEQQAAVLLHRGRSSTWARQPRSTSLRFAVALMFCLSIGLTESYAQTNRSVDAARVSFPSADGKTELVGYLFKP